MFYSNWFIPSCFEVIRVFEITNVPCQHYKYKSAYKPCMQNYSICQYLLIRQLFGYEPIDLRLAP